MGQIRRWRGEVRGFPPLRPTTPATKTCRRGPREGAKVGHGVLWRGDEEQLQRTDSEERRLAAAEAARLDRGRYGQMGLAGGKDGEEAVLAFAGAGGFHAFHLLEREVEQAAFAAVPGRT